MKKITLIELFKTIRHSLVSFISIVLFLTLGNGLYLGLSLTSKTLRMSTQEETQKYKLYDIQISSDYGFSDSDIETIQNINKNAIVEPTNYSSEICYINDFTYAVNVWQITNQLNKFQSVEGNLPTSPNEIAISRDFAEQHNITIGDSIQFRHNFTDTAHLLYSVFTRDESETFIDEKESKMKYLNDDCFTVTSIVSNILSVAKGTATSSFSKEKLPIDANFFVHQSAFDMKATNGYSCLMIYFDELSTFNYYSAEYDNKIQDLLNTYSEAFDSLIENKMNSLVDGTLYLIANNFERIVDIVKGVEDLTPFILTTKNQNDGLAIVEIYYNALANVRWPFSLIFYAISLIVTCFVITRSITNQKKIIGTKKAIGFTDFQIFKNFLIFTLFSSGLGSMLGIFVGKFVIEEIATEGFMNNLSIFSRIKTFNIFEILIIILSEIILVTLLTYFIVRKTIKTDTVSLLNNEKPQKVHFYQKWKNWFKLSLITRTIINNLANDRVRIINTLIGVMCCSSLIMCGLTFSRNLTGTGQYHYDVVQNYDTIVYFDNDETYEVSSNIASKLNELNCLHSEVYSSWGILHFDEYYSTASINVVDDEKFDSLMNFIDKDGKTMSITENRVYLTKALAEYYGIETGDRFTFINGNKVIKIPSVTVIEYYLPVQSIFLNKSTYFAYFNTDVFIPNCSFLERKTLSKQSLEQSLNSIDGYKLTYDLYGESVKSLEDLQKTFTPLSALYIALAILLASIILVNINNSLIKEKKNDLSVLLINGYTTTQCKKYISLDLVLISALGIIFGIGLGYLFSLLSFKAISSAAFVFLTEFNIRSALMTVLLTSALIFTITYISLRPIGTLNLDDISNE